MLLLDASSAGKKCPAARIQEEILEKCKRILAEEHSNMPTTVDTTSWTHRAQGTNVDRRDFPRVSGRQTAYAYIDGMLGGLYQVNSRLVDLFASVDRSGRGRSLCLQHKDNFAVDRSLCGGGRCAHSHGHVVLRGGHLVTEGGCDV